MRICYLADADSIHTKRWCIHFASLGHEVHLISFKKGGIEGVHFHFVDTGNISVKGGNWKVMFKANKVKSLVREINPDVLHAMYATSYGVVGALSGFHPYIITALGSDVLISPQQSILYRLLVKFALKRADLVTAMAEHMREIIIAMGINPGKVNTLVFGIDTAIFNHTKRVPPANKFVITSTRNFESVYNLQLLIKAVQLVSKEIPNLEVNLIGAGSQREELEKMIADYKLVKSVKFFGKVSQTEIADTLNKTHLFTSTSLSDGNNISLNEAMACGTVSLATDIPANRQWIKEGVNGFLVPLHDEKYLADKILYVYRNYTQMQKSSIEFNDKIIEEKATWVKNMVIVENIYTQLSVKK